jgi:hypothetical protein
MGIGVVKEEISRETRDGEIVRMRIEGQSYKAIAERVGLSISQCHRVYEAAIARRRGDYDLKQLLDQVFCDLQGLLDELRPWVLQSQYSEPTTPRPLTKDLIGDFLKTIGRFCDVFGLNAAKRTHVPDRTEVEENDEAAEYVAKLAIWAHKNRAISVDGYAPALPPGMTERVQPSANGSNGHAKIRPHGLGSMWSLVLEYPALDDDADDDDGDV